MPFDFYFGYLHAVRNQNTLRHVLTKIEDTWMTDWWECTVFSFILVISEFNSFWFYATLSTVGYVRREFLRNWIFVRSWRGNLFTIYTLGKGRGGLSSFQTPFIGWLMHQGTREDIRTGYGFALQKLPISSTAAALI